MSERNVCAHCGNWECRCECEPTGKRLMNIIRSKDAEIAELTAKLAQSREEAMKGHRAFAALFGEIMNGRDFDVKASIAQAELAELRKVKP